MQLYVGGRQNGKTSSLIKQDVLSLFDMRQLAWRRTPIAAGEFKFGSFFPSTRVNHYLIKSSDSQDFCFGDVRLVAPFVRRTMQIADNLGLPWRERYCYLTVDQGPVKQGQALRTPGWHIDGLQGDEVPIKMPMDFTFTWADAAPTLFAAQSFDTRGLDLSKHNAFDWLARQIEPACVEETRPFVIYVSSYHVHAAALAREDIAMRRFVRVSFTHVPVTSTKMTVNPNMHYNYEYHTTSGEIPAHLK